MQKKRFCIHGQFMWYPHCAHVFQDIISSVKCWHTKQRTLIQCKQTSTRATFFFSVVHSISTRSDFESVVLLYCIIYHKGKLCSMNDFFIVGCTVTAKIKCKKGRRRREREGKNYAKHKYWKTVFANTQPMCKCVRGEARLWYFRIHKFANNNGRMNENADAWEEKRYMYRLLEYGIKSSPSIIIRWSGTISKQAFCCPSNRQPHPNVWLFDGNCHVTTRKHITRHRNKKKDEIYLVCCIIVECDLFALFFSCL